MCFDRFVGVELLLTLGVAGFLLRQLGLRFLFRHDNLLLDRFDRLLGDFLLDALGRRFAGSLALGSSSSCAAATVAAAATLCRHGLGRLVLGGLVM